MDSSQQRRTILKVAIGVMILGVVVAIFGVGKWLIVTSQPEPSSALAADLAEPETSSTEEVAPEEAAPEDAVLGQEATAVPHAQKAPSLSEPVVVYISGAVTNPDTYRLPADARVKDVVIAAGGLTSDADSEHINLAEHISDAEHIYVPHVGEEATPSSKAGAAPEASKGDEGTTGLVNLNTASAAQIEALPKIGQALAQRIIDWRTANGPFQSTADVQKVKGISPAVYDAIKDLVTVE